MDYYRGVWHYSSCGRKGHEGFVEDAEVGTMLDIPGGGAKQALGA